jgi:hypothetical protein
VVVTLDSRLAPALHAHALKVIFSPEGVLVAASKDGQVDGAIAASKTTLGWWSPAYGRNWVDPKNMLKPSAYVELLLNPNPADKKVANLTFGAGLSSEQGPGFQLSVTFAPGCFLYVASSGNLSLRRAGDIYEVRSTGNDRVVRFDLAHGRISVASAAHPDAPENLIVHTEPGALPQTMRDLDATSGANGFKADAHFSSFFAQAMSEIADLPSVQREYPHFFSSTTPAQRTGAIAAAQQLLSTGLAKMSDKFGQLYAGGGDDDFEIPSPQDDQPQSDQDIKKFITGLYALTAWALPPDSWSRILISQVAVMYLSSARDFRGISDWLDRVDSGPLLDLTIASLTAHTPFGMDWAQHGLGRLSGADFARDYNIVLRQPCGLHDTVLDLAAAWRDLDDAQAENLLAVLPSEEARLLRRTRADLRANPKVPIADTLAAELDEQWKDSWRVRVEATLSVIAHPPPPPATGRH